MIVGDRYTSPWGDYTVIAVDPVVIKQGTGYIVDPSSRMRELLVWSGRLPETLDHENEKGTGPSPHASADGGGSPSESHAETIVGNDDHLYAHQLTLGAFRSTLSMAWAPGKDMQVWVPCLGRSQIQEFATKTHVYFMSSLNGSIYCPECRALRPRILHTRDGVVVRDSHHDIASASTSLGFRLVEATGPEFSRPDLSPETDAPLCVSGAGAESSSPELLAMAVARESMPEGEPPAPDVREPIDAAKTTPSPVEIVPPTFIARADDPKESVGSFEKLPRTPIGRAWMGLWEWKEWCAERAAIIEYDANLPRKIAEQSARVLAGVAPRAA